MAGKQSEQPQQDAPENVKPGDEVRLGVPGWLEHGVHDLQCHGMATKSAEHHLHVSCTMPQWKSAAIYAHTAQSTGTKQTLWWCGLQTNG